MRATSLLRLLLGVSGLVFAQPAFAAAPAKEPTPEEVDRARTFFNAGVGAYSAARYADAVRSFEQAYELAPRPQVLFSLAQAERKEFFAGNDASYLRRAIQHYREYLEQVPSGGRRSEATEAKADLEARQSRLDPQQAVSPAPASGAKRKARVTVYSPTPGARASLDGGAPQEVPFFSDLEPGKHRVRVFAEGYVDEERDVSGDTPVDQPLDLPLKERPAQITVALGSVANVYVDGHIVATTPLARPIEVPPGPHVLSVTANGKKPFSQEVVLPRGKPYRFEPKLETSGQRVAAYTMLGLGVAGVVTGGAFALAALGQENKVHDIDDARAQGNIDADQLQAHNRAIDKRDDFRTVSIVSLSTGAALVAGGAILYAFDHPSVGVQQPRSIEPGPVPKHPEHSIDLSASPLVAPGTWGGVVTGRF
ncbi:TonB-dependent receptor [Labilithrix luteola]|uniref:TonB-dependent receptor n=1 Tax=Labilithrix luteola TaxID=1391654 RepID=A0A0K1Q9Y9_9BACT|nr:PEGA domain-containing protein [Labilithrix luteola]AKV02559.1 TonB-dependent receptor [Labilithrix luteola]